MLEHADGESGWEVFTLVYKVDAPLDTVLDPKAMLSYQRMFNHLWKMKRMDAALMGLWTKAVRARKMYAGDLPGKRLIFLPCFCVLFY
jgi:gamma-tubulin complex component 3